MVRGLGWMDASGKVERLAVKDAAFESPRLSPDGTRIAVGIGTETEADIWIQELPVTSVPRRLTFGGRHRFHVWSPDGKQLAFQSDRDGTDSVYLQDVDRPGAQAQLLLKADPGVSLIPTHWSRNGWLALTVVKGGSAVVHVASVADRKLVPFAVPPAGQQTRGGSFSADGRWLAYQVSPPGSFPTVFVEPFPQTGQRYQLDAGNFPTWLPGSLDLLISPGGAAFETYRLRPTPSVTFTKLADFSRGPLFGLGMGSGRPWDFSTDGKRLLVVLPTTVVEKLPNDMHVVLNWFEELKKVQ